MEPIDPLHLLLAEGVADYAIFLLDTSGKVSRWSSSAEKVFGYTAKEIQGCHFSCFYPSGEENVSRVTEELEMAAAHGRFEDTAWRVRRDGTRFWADAVLCPMRGEKGEIHSFSLVIRDISDRKKTEDALRSKEEELSQARKMEAIGRLAGSVAHDFNNFITGIVGLADEVRLSMAEQDPRRQDLDEIIRTADQARMLTRGLLAFGRRQMAAPQVVQLNTVLNEKQRILTRLLGGAHIELRMHLDPAIRHILIDPTQLDQLLINLIMNGRDSIPQGGIIRIETHRAANAEEAAGPQVLLVISDTGSGMDEHVLEHLFEPFFTTKEQGKGTGLGLSTVYGIVKQNHGDISVKSRVGEGTIFTIRFPEIDAPVQVQQELPSVAAESGFETVLVVEDMDIVRRVVIQALQKYGYRVLAASSGAEAIALAQQHEKIDLVLTDVVMPGMSGRELIERLQVSHADASILYMSAYTEDLIQERGFLGEGVAFIEKPFTSHSLLHKVQEVLNNRRLDFSRNTA